VIIFDNELTPSQQRNWEKLAGAGIAVIDRQEVILDIFAQRAQTREARLQIELAQMQYSLPRLTRAWSHLVRQGGGIGARGEGETQLEQDKRRVRGAIDRCKKSWRRCAKLALRSARIANARQCRMRHRRAIQTPANRLCSAAFTGADVLVEDKLFATLDTTTRKIALPNKQPSAAHGHRRLCPQAPASPRRGVQRDARRGRSGGFSHPSPRCERAGGDGYYNTTMKVLSELGADEKRMLVVFNKIDRLTD
jgi:GTP-binding protein HflX